MYHFLSVVILKDKVNWINACETSILFLQAELFAWGSMYFGVKFTLLQQKMRISHWSLLRYTLVSMLTLSP
jgi:hypothetical protein